MGNALAGGSGWVLLVYVPRDRRLVNQYASDHSQAFAGGIPILALDMYEHAYHIDFGANAKAYVDAFVRNIDGKAVEERYEDASKVEPPRPLVQKEFGDLPGVGVEEVKAMLEAGKPVQFIDARPKPGHSADTRSTKTIPSQALLPSPSGRSVYVRKGTYVWISIEER